MDELGRQEFLVLECRYWEAMKLRDAAAAAALSAQTTILLGAQGIGELPREALAGMVVQPTFELLDYELDDVHVREVSADTVIVAYTVTETLRVQHEPLTLVAHDASLWVKEDDHWVCSLHTESPAGDPFGRDRTTA